MENQATRKLGLVGSSVFNEIGNFFNPTEYIKSTKYLKLKTIENDRKALSEDWNAVGGEVKIAIARFEETFRTESGRR